MVKKLLLLIGVCAISILAVYVIKVPKYVKFESSFIKLAFEHRSDWICTEVVYRERVDCFPKERKDELYDAGLDQPIVHFPEIVILVEKCNASVIPDFTGDPDMYIPSHSFIKNYNDCNILIDVQDKAADTEEKLDAIIKKIQK